MPAGQQVEIRGINGSIHAEPATGNDVEVVAHKTGQVDEDVAGIEVQVVEHDGGVTFCAVYPSVNGHRSECLPGASSPLNAISNDVNIDFTVRLPKGVRFVGRTVNGQVEAKALQSDTEAHTVNGNVRLSTAGAAFGETVNGSIIASVGKINSDSKFSDGERRHHGRNAARAPPRKFTPAPKMATSTPISPYPCMMSTPDATRTA